MSAWREKAVIVRQGVRYVSALASQYTQTPLTEDEYSLRIATCRGCDQFRAATDPEQIGHCRACGCGVTARAALASKARLPGARCPRGQWVVRATPP